MTNATAQTITLALEVADAQIGIMAGRLAELEAVSLASEVEIIFTAGPTAPAVVMPTRGTANAPGAIGRPDACHKGAKTDASTFVPASTLGTLRMKVLIACFYSVEPRMIGDSIDPKWLAANVADENGFNNWATLASAAAGRNRLANAGLLERVGPASKAIGFLANASLFDGAATALTWEGGQVASHRLALVR